MSQKKAKVRELPKERDFKPMEVVSVQKRTGIELKVEPCTPVKREK